MTRRVNREIDVIVNRHLPYVRVRVERTMKWVSSQVLDEYKALGGDARANLGIDEDAELKRAAAETIQHWAGGSDGILGYAAQWGFLEMEVAVIHHVKVFVNGELAWEGEVV